MTTPRTHRQRYTDRPWGWDRTLLWLILIVGGWLRFQSIGDIEFNVDQMYPIWQGLMTIERGEFPLAGQGTSVLFANPTLTGYIFAPFLAFARTPLVAYVVTITLNSFALWLGFRALKTLLDVRVALVATALFAVNPWLVEYSRTTWVQSLLPFFVCLIFWALAPVLAGKTTQPERRLLIAATASAIFANTYLLSYLIVAPVGLLVLLFWRRIPLQTLAAGVGIFALFAGLYGVGLLNQWEDTRAKAEDFFGEGDSQLSDEALTHALRLVTGWEYPAARGTDAPADDATLRNDLTTGLHWVWTLLLVLGIGRAVQQLVQRKTHRDTALILLVWFLLPIAAMSYVSRVVHPFYLIFTVPAGHALAAWGLVPLLTWQAGRNVVVGALLFTGALNGLNTLRFAQETAANPGEHRPYTLPLRESIALGHDIADIYEPGMTVYTPMDTWAPMTFAADIFPVVQLDNPQDILLIPPEGGVYMTFHAPDRVLEPPLHGRPATIPLTFADGTRAAIWYAQQDFSPGQAADIPSDIGVRFVGWHLLAPLRAGETSALRTYWRVDALPPERFGWAFVPFVHVFNGDGERVAIIDGEPAPLQQWRAGDWMVQEMEIPVPPDSSRPYAVDVGVFDGQRMVNAIFNYPDDNGEMIFTATIRILE
jgi:hypothetical protein